MIARWRPSCHSRCDRQVAAVLSLPLWSPGGGRPVTPAVVPRWWPSYRSRCGRQVAAVLSLPLWSPGGGRPFAPVVVARRRLACRSLPLWSPGGDRPVTHSRCGRQVAAVLSLPLCSPGGGRPVTPVVVARWWPSCHSRCGRQVVAVLSLAHVAVHLLAVTVNPADANVRQQMSRRSFVTLQLDRRLHKHAIENLHCFLCDVDVSVQILLGAVS